jgi:nitroreductase
MEESPFVCHVFNTIRTRRSVRAYAPIPVEDWKLDMILEAARLAPSSTNSQPWRIIVVKDEEKRAILAKATPNNIRQHPWLLQSPIVLILCASKSAVQKIFQVVGKNYHLVDMGIVGDHICLTAAELDLGTCWIGWCDKSKIKKAFHIPFMWDVVCLIALGYPLGTTQEQIAKKEISPIQILPQTPGELGIGAIPARERFIHEKIVFFETARS